MARRAMMILAATAMAMAYRSIPVTAQTSCTTAIISLAPCLSYISGNSTAAPSSSCCSQLSNVVKSQPQCLCTVLNGGFSIGVSLNKTRALALPGACKVQTPPVSECNASSGGPKTSPAKSPAAAPSSPVSPSSNPAPSTSPSNTPSTGIAPTGTAPSGNGSKSKNGESSKGSSDKSVVLFMFSAVFFASCF
ncbi:hypothetical protein M5K25_017806 [Dendrobium thyrsiflorum]|uniref:Bifunctional inhibitor/plant lipid transfer protein/seed storage helical domain-containing protein n=1 Tax=Dendrobium thyrsiflorum TaxID=117978 RepID=A0ABD0UGD4_DENTH